MRHHLTPRMLLAMAALGTSLAGADALAAVPIRVEAGLGGGILDSEGAYGVAGARFLSKFGPVSDKGTEGGLMADLSVFARPLSPLELGIEIGHWSVSEKFVSKTIREVFGKQETDVTPAVGLVGVRAVLEGIAFSLHAGVGAASVSVDRAGYLDDGERRETMFVSHYRGQIDLNPVGGLQLGLRLSRTELDLPGTGTEMPVEGDRDGGIWRIEFGVGWEFEVGR